MAAPPEDSVKLEDLRRTLEEGKAPEVPEPEEADDGCVPDTGIRRPEVELSEDTDGNANAIIAKVSRALRKAGCPVDVVAAYKTESRAGDYDHLIQTAMKYAEVT